MYMYGKNTGCAFSNRSGIWCGLMRQLLSGLVEVAVAFVMMTYRYEESAGWGFRSRDGTWNGLVGRLLSGHVEVAAALVMMTPERHRVVDFSLPLIFSGLNVYIQEPREQEFRWVHFLLPFDNCLWLCTVTLVVTTWVVLRIQRRCRKAAENEGGDKGTYSDFLQVVGIFLMQGVGTGQDTTSRDCVRASLAVASLSALLLYTAYCGALTAALASGQPRLPFHDMSGLLRDGSYTLITQAGAAAMNTLSDSKNPVDRKIYKLHIEGKDMPRTAAEMFRRLCSSQKHAVMVSKTSYLQSNSDLQCPVTLVHESKALQEGFAVTKKNPYREAINYHLLRLRSEGVLNRLLWNSCWVDGTQRQQQQSTPMVGARQVAPALVVLAAAGMAALCLLVLENACCRRGAKVVRAAGGYEGSGSSVGSRCSVHPVPTAVMY
ncbi:probable glutamate receptor [Schistocerca serialis cubense]|uniref:probable glutamate receptor n=1 Tax=Schistocerca serialis cubense TaxID=2023355 RepID=UPI00214E6275|nr:probable glutamate receptor [Schistocerca serialis cubense]